MLVNKGVRLPRRASTFYNFDLTLLFLYCFFMLFNMTQARLINQNHAFISFITLAFKFLIINQQNY